MYARYVIYDNWCLENVEFGMHMVASDELLFAKPREAAELLFAETGDKFYSQLADRFSKNI